MASYADRFKMNDDKLPVAAACLEPIRDTCPNVRDVLLGIYEDDGTEIVKRASIGIWLDGKTLKYVITPKGHGEKGWGVIRDVCNILGSIELDLIEDRVDWKEGKNTQSQSTDVPY